MPARSPAPQPHHSSLQLTHLPWESNAGFHKSLHQDSWFHFSGVDFCCLDSLSRLCKNDQTYTSVTHLWACMARGAHPALRTSQQTTAFRASGQDQSCHRPLSSAARIAQSRPHPAPQLWPCFYSLLTASQAKHPLLGTAHTAPRKETPGKYLLQQG